MTFVPIKFITDHNKSTIIPTWRFLLVCNIGHLMNIYTECEYTYYMSTLEYYRCVLVCSMEPNEHSNRDNFRL